MSKIIRFVETALDDPGMGRVMQLQEVWDRVPASQQSNIVRQANEFASRSLRGVDRLVPVPWCQFESSLTRWVKIVPLFAMCSNADQAEIVDYAYCVAGVEHPETIFSDYVYNVGGK
ncbi:hypothetical protein [Aureliella helgolandensis]|uniref:Uncharacterized protein n=1 Tax=Aureliella helgolandensis TaxID=2527968 RepID=A0A518GE86_9BACT|nr:hypothetical protein [Aureliella helgolandensis]QDV26903.1 hypothetical protein Q31a_52830 [Aureliella helgolandensis]